MMGVQPCPVGFGDRLPEMSERIREKTQFRTAGALGAALQQLRNGFRRDRKSVVVIAEYKTPFAPLQCQLAGFDDPARMILQDREENLVAQPLLGRIPLYVEIGSIPAERPVLESVPPPGIERSGDRHMIWNDV